MVVTRIKECGDGVLRAEEALVMGAQGNIPK